MTPFVNDTIPNPKSSVSVQPENAACRFCGSSLKTVFVDLGMSPLSNAYIRIDELNNAEAFYPLKTYVCDCCFLVQLLQYESPESIFSDYAYFSSYSDTWLEHSRQYADMICDRLQLDHQTFVVELASNDGYLLQYFIKKNIPVLGVEPAENVALAAQEKQIPTIARFFGRNLAQELIRQGKAADLIIGNNVLAHVPDINDFVAGMKILLKPGGVITMEFPHLLELITHNQFDTIYHEHFSYLSLLTVEKIFAHHGLKVFDVEQLSTHGGSLRIFAAHFDAHSDSVTDRIVSLRAMEFTHGLTDMQKYLTFAERVKETKRALLKCLIGIKENGKKIAAYGAAAKGNTLLNYCGIRTDIIDYVADRSPHKVGKFLPGTHIPVTPPEHIQEDRPDYLLILPWNLKEEIVEQTKYIRQWGGRFIIPIPDIQIVD